MEYLLLSFFILMVILVMILFLTGWFFSQQGLEQQNIEKERALTMLERLTNSPLFVKENSVFDDSKLIAIQSLGETSACRDFQDLFGSGWFMELEVLSRPGGDCDWSSYLNCGHWKLVCGRAGARNISYDLPVNIYRKVEDRTDLGSLKAGIYT